MSDDPVEQIATQLGVSASQIERALDYIDAPDAPVPDEDIRALVTLLQNTGMIEGAREYAESPRRFTGFNEPVFDEADVTKYNTYWRDSVYRWWFEALRRSDRYRNGELPELQADFGNLDQPFKDWWLEDQRGERLFAEPRTINENTVVEITQAYEAATFLNREDWLVFAVPRGFNPANVGTAIERNLEHQGNEPRSRRKRESKARYPVTGKFTRFSTEQAFEAYDLKQADDLEPWEIAARVRNETVQDAHHKAELQRQGKQMLNRAKAMIEAAEQGRFPS